MTLESLRIAVASGAATWEDVRPLCFSGSPVEVPVWGNFHGNSDYVIYEYEEDGDLWLKTSRGHSVLASEWKVGSWHVPDTARNILGN